MMPHRFSRLRRFRFNLPQRIAAGMLALFLLQGLWLIAHQTLTEDKKPYAPGGYTPQEQSSPVTDGILAYRMAELSRTLNQAPGGNPFVYALLLRLPFLAAGCVLGGGLWWVTRRLYGNRGGYTALALYCFSPAVLRASVTPGPEVLAMLGVYGGVYTSIGVSHAMQGPRRKWRPRIVLLTVIFGIAAAAHLAALFLTVLLGITAMLWVAEGRRSQVPPVMLTAVLGALAFTVACYGFSLGAFKLIPSSAGVLRISLIPAWRFFLAPANIGVTATVAAALALYFAARRSRYFGNTAPLLCSLALMLLVMPSGFGLPWLWALPFLLTFVGGVLADAYESRQERLAMGCAGALVLLQAILCVWSLPGRP